MADVIPLDKYGRIKYAYDPDEAVFKVALYVWNAATVAWERMVQPTIEISGDLTVTMGDVERLLGDQYYARMKIYAYDSGRPKYICKNTDIDAAESDADWYCWKLTDAALPDKEGPRLSAVAAVGTIDAKGWNI